MKKILILFIMLLLLPTSAMAVNACDPNSGGGSTTLCNPTGQFASDLPTAALWLARGFGIALSLTAIVMLMFSGFRMIMSQGNSEEIEKAKSAFQWTLAGFILALFAYIIVYAISDFIKVKDIQTGSKFISNPIQGKTFGDLLINMIKGTLKIVGLLTILMIIIGAIRYMTAQGKEEQVEQAKVGLQWAIIGLIVVLFSYVIVVAIAQLFGASVTQN